MNSTVNDSVSYKIMKRQLQTARNDRPTDHRHADHSMSERRSCDFAEATTLMSQAVQCNANILIALIMHLSDEEPRGSNLLVISGD